MSAAVVGITLSSPRFPTSVSGATTLHPGAEAKTVGHCQFLSLSRISSNRRWEKASFSTYIRHSASSIPVMTTPLGTHKSLPLVPHSLPFWAHLQVQLPSEARGEFINHKAKLISTIPCSEASHGLPISQVHTMGDRPHMIWPPLRPHLTSLPPPSCIHTGLPNILSTWSSSSGLWASILHLPLHRQMEMQLTLPSYRAKILLSRGAMPHLKHHLLSCQAPAP